MTIRYHKKIGLQSTAFGKGKPFKDRMKGIRKFDLDFVEIRPHHHPDIDYIGQKKGNIYFKKECMKYIKDCCGDLQFQLHFKDILFDKIKGLCSGEKDVIKFILDLAEETNKYNDDFVLPLHVMYAKKGVQEIPVKEAMKNARKGLKELYKNWDFSGKLALETMMEPFRYKGSALFGYKPSQLEHLIDGKEDKFGICIDTGHVNKGLNDVANFNDFTHLPVYEIHFQGNHSHTGKVNDDHIFPSKATLNDYTTVKKYLSTYKGLVNLEVTDIIALNWLRDIIKELR